MENLRPLIVLMLFACFIYHLWYWLFSQSAGNRFHLARLRHAEQRVNRLKLVYAAEAQAVTREERAVNRMSEYEFMRYLAFTVVDSYEGLDLWARRIWSDYQLQLDHRAAGKQFAVESPTPEGARVIYLDAQQVTTPTPEGEGKNIARTLVLKAARARKTGARVVSINRKKKSYAG